MCVMRAAVLWRGCGRGTLVQAEMVDRLFEFLKEPSINGVQSSLARAGGSSAKATKLQHRRAGKVC